MASKKIHKSPSNSRTYMKQTKCKLHPCLYINRNSWASTCQECKVMDVKYTNLQPIESVFPASSKYISTHLSIHSTQIPNNPIPSIHTFLGFGFWLLKFVTLVVVRPVDLSWLGLLLLIDTSYCCRSHNVHTTRSTTSQWVNCTSGYRLRRVINISKYSAKYCCSTSTSTLFVQNTLQNHESHLAWAWKEN